MSDTETFESGKTDGVQYRETICLRGPDRGGELHCCNPQVVMLALASRDGRTTARWFRQVGPEDVDEAGHALFIHECLVDKMRSNIDPRARAVV